MATGLERKACLLERRQSDPNNSVFHRRSDQHLHLILDIEMCCLVLIIYIYMSELICGLGLEFLPADPVTSKQCRG
jgi:hypothetical protein